MNNGLGMIHVYTYTNIKPSTKQWYTLPQHSKLVTKSSKSN